MVRRRREVAPHVVFFFMVRSLVERRPEVTQHVTSKSASAARLNMIGQAFEALASPLLFFILFF